MNAFLILAILTAGAITAVALVLRKIAFPKAHLPITAGWIDELSVERYRPMMRLLDGADFEFLSSQPGIDRKSMRRLRYQRARIFRGYLRDLNTDFASICLAIKLMMLQSNIDRPDLASTLVRSQIAFAGRMLAIHAGLVVYALGLGRVEVGGLLKLFDGMRLELRSLSAESAVWGS